MTAQTCSCGRPLLKETSSSSSSTTTCPHYNQTLHSQIKYTLPDRPKSTSTPPPHHFRAPVSYTAPRRSLDIPSPFDIPYHRSNSNASAASSGPASPNAPPKSLHAGLSDARRSSSVDMAYSPIAAGFARLSRKEREAAALKARAERSMGLDPGRMFAGAA